MTLSYDFNQSPSFWIELTYHVLETALNRELAPTGVTLRQAQVLACLSLYGDRSQVELADDLRIEPPTLVRVLDRMERDGWVERHPSPDDRRKKLIRPTKKAEPTWKKLIELGKRVEDTATAGFSKRELETLRDLLERIRANFEDESDV